MQYDISDQVVDHIRICKRAVQLINIRIDFSIKIYSNNNIYIMLLF